MITDEMIHGPIARPPRRRIQNATPIAPRAAAEAVWQEARVYLKAELPRAWVRRLTVRANMVYQRNARFRALLCKDGDAGRDWLWAFTRHWLAALIWEQQGDMHSRLPAEFLVGRTLPLTHQ